MGLWWYGSTYSQLFNRQQPSGVLMVRGADLDMTQNIIENRCCSPASETASSNEEYLALGCDGM
jgi:hypothetical protein